MLGPPFPPLPSPPLPSPPLPSPPLPSPPLPSPPLPSPPLPSPPLPSPLPSPSPNYRKEMDVPVKERRAPNRPVEALNRMEEAPKQELNGMEHEKDTPTRGVHEKDTPTRGEHGKDTPTRGEHEKDTPIREEHEKDTPTRGENEKDTSTRTRRINKDAARKSILSNLRTTGSAWIPLFHFSCVLLGQVQLLQAIKDLATLRKLLPLRLCIHPLPPTPPTHPLLPPPLPPVFQ